jgi:PAS domain-containing protein
MNAKDLEIFNVMPFLFWVKDEEGRYIWGNRAISEIAKQDIIGKKDAELPWAANAEALRADDKKVLETGKPIFVHEYVDDSSRGKITLSVCKFIGELDGKKHAFGISFVIEKGD